MNHIEVSSTHRSFAVDARRVKLYTKKTLEILHIDGIALDIFLISQPRMRFLNKTFRKKDKATNVLSFCEPKEFVGVPSKQKYLGEIYISPAYIREHQQDISHMVVHGVLHLLGFDHETVSDQKRMERKEDEILRVL